MIAALARHLAGAQHLQRLHAVAGDEERVEDLVLLKCALHVHDVNLVVFDEQDIQHPFGHHISWSRRYQVKPKVAPRPSAESSQTRPPRLSTIFLTRARPMPGALDLVARLERLEHAPDPLVEQRRRCRDRCR